MTEDLRVVVAGGGRVGFQTAVVLADRGHDVIVIEEDSNRVDEIADAYLATVVEGDATNPDVLRQADPERADVVAALTGKTGANLAVCMAATRMDETVRTVARIDSPAGEAYTEFVDAVVYPERAGARAAVNEIVGSAVRTLEDVTGDLDVMEVQAAEDAPATGKTLRELRLPRGALVVSSGDGDRVAAPDTTVTAGMRYVVAAEPDVVDEVMNLFRG
jgi:trk system potassium uptake protein TrkA